MDPKEITVKLSRSRLEDFLGEPPTTEEHLARCVKSYEYELVRRLEDYFPGATVTVDAEWGRLEEEIETDIENIYESREAPPGYEYVRDWVKQAEEEMGNDWTWCPTE